MMETNTQHWRLEQKENIAWLYFDKKNSAVNTIDKSVLIELASLLTGIEKDKSIHGLIITSGKANSFIVGADIQTISFLTNEKEVFDFIRQGQLVFDQLAALKMPTVALLKGFCLGGGLELALACHYRIAIDNPQTRLGLPEVLLGIHPGWGGTVRLPRLLGAVNALQLMLTGKMLSAQAAAKVGLVNCVVPERHAETAALYYAHLQKRSAGFSWKSLSNLAWIRNGIAALFHRRLVAKVNPQHYPAPYQMLAHWRQVGVSDKAFLDEAESLSQLAMTPTARHLIHIYFLRERLSQLGKKYTGTFKHVHVVGAGTMGGDIAAWCALQGMVVTLQDREPKYLAPAIRRAYALFKKRLKKPRAIQMAMDRLLPDVAGYSIRRADLVIEAIFEDLTVKQNLFRQLEAQVKPDTILATNTSSIVLEEIQQGLKQPERLIGLHFFNPVAKMPLVEVVQAKINSPEVIEKALAFVHQINRLPLPVKSSPGFLVNRLLMPYLLHAVLLLEKGIPAPVIDKAALDFGMPMGPLELADTVGLDICLAVAKILHQALQSPPPLPEGLEKMVASKRLGKKTKQGFYRYDKKGQAIKEKIPDDYKVPNDLIDRLIDPMIEEAKKCLHEKVVEDTDLLDAGMVFGTGFAPFRGGLMQYAKENKKI
ncbi:3-hydroxyacyl-CoA dehydrogenase NAD-binding domain-containing protein [Rickettsiella endosymbiont of Dermanyssus gallinae]|uniref:3-hydroxyacyl-CoA dehydrogenase NAD-binding domain-containing protein n=1 Tax=Rickettsiella endosymbiont of Dermanyssus gallinae TaxID=2856608 RepID=UPI001C531058|nr:3-hydroxyacyl-CoA dehydrogenase NAD-binding domain-containing protein [Rickettsiella endosymbiont of Dermanyssus gallinae]